MDRGSLVSYLVVLLVVCNIASNMFIGGGCVWNGCLTNQKLNVIHVTLYSSSRLIWHLLSSLALSLLYFLFAIMDYRLFIRI